MSDLVIHFAVYDRDEGRILSSLPTALGASPTEGVYRLRVACNPSLTLPSTSDNYGLSVDPRVVSCSACKQTEDYQREVNSYLPSESLETTNTTPTSNPTE